MNQHHHHLFKEKDIEVKWGIQQKASQHNNNLPNLPNQQVTYDISIENTPEIETQPGFTGGKVTFSNGQSFLAQIQESNSLCYLFDTQINTWIQLQQKVDEFQQQQQQQQPLQLIPQQNQADNEQGLGVEVVNFNNLNEYQGFISGKDLESQTEGLADLEDLNKEIEDNITNIFDNNCPVQLKLQNQDSSLDVKFKLAKGKKMIEYNIKIKLTLKEQNPEEQEKRRKEKEQKKQQEKLEQIEKNLEKLQSDSVVHNQIVNQIKQDIGSLKSDLQKQLQQVEQKVNLQSGQIQQVESKVNLQSGQIGQVESNLNLQIQQVEQKVNLQCQQLIQKQQNPFTKISLNQLQLAQQQEQYIYVTKIFDGSYEFELSLADDEAEFEVGIIADGDLYNIEKKTKSYYISLPDGTFKRGTAEFGKLLTYNLQIDDKLGVRVDTTKHLLQMIINDYPFPPIRISDGIEEFSFVVKSSNELQQFAGDTNA